MDNLSYIIGLNNGEGGGGASSWSDIDGKPFSTVNTTNGLTITSGALSVDQSIIATKAEIPEATSVTVTQTLQSGTEIADIEVNGVTTTLYAPEATASTPTWSDVTDKPFNTIGAGLTTTSGALQEAVPLYTETTTVPGDGYGPGMYFDSGFGTDYDAAEDLDIHFNIGENNTLNLDTESDPDTAPYRVAIKMTNGDTYDGVWVAYDEEGHTYGGETWSIYVGEGEDPDSGDHYVIYDTHELYIEDEGDGVYHLHILGAGSKNTFYMWDGATCLVSEVCIYEDPDRAVSDPQYDLESQCEDFGLEYNSITNSSTTTVIHQLPSEYVKIDNDTIKINNDGNIYVNSATLTTSWNNISNKPAINAGSGVASIVEGNGNNASGDYSHVEGYGNTATKYCSHAEGYASEAFGQGSHAEGQSQAFGSYSHSEGANTFARGAHSHAEGTVTIADSTDQHVQGHYNITDSNDVYADIIGNGSSASARSNAEATDWNGNKYLAGDVYVGVTNWGTTPTIGAKKLEPVSITNTLSSGTAIGDIDIGGVTTTLYAPSSAAGVTPDWNAASGQDGYIENKPSIVASSNGGTVIGTGNTTNTGSGAIIVGTGGPQYLPRATGQRSVYIGTASKAAHVASGNDSVVIGGGQAAGNNAVAIGGAYARKFHTISIGDNCGYDYQPDTEHDYNVYIGNGLVQQSASISNPVSIRGYYNYFSNSTNPLVNYVDILGNGISSSRSTAEATDYNGNKYLAGNIYTNVTNWSDPQNNGTLLANIPSAPTTTAGTFTLQAVVDGSGNITYSWVAQV